MPPAVSRARTSATAGIVGIEADVLEDTPPAAIGEVRFSNPPTIVNGTAIIGSGVRDNHRYNAPSGAVRAFDARTGAPRWSFDPIPRDREVATATRLDGRCRDLHRRRERLGHDERRRGT